MSQKSCRNRTLAMSRHVKVEECESCGVIAIHVGPLSLRLDGAAAEDLARTVGEALTERAGAHALPATTWVRGHA